MDGLLVEREPEVRGRGAEPIEVRVGGAIVFVLDVERFARI